MLEPSTWQSNSVFASFYLCDHQHALASLRSLCLFLAAGGRIGLFSPLSTLEGGGGGGEKILVHSNPFTYFIIIIVFVFSIVLSFIPGLRSRSRRFLDGVGFGVGILRVLGVVVGIFDPTPTPKDQLNSFSTCFACSFLLLRPI